MRYRPFGRSGNACSALTLSLNERALNGGRNACSALVFAALEAGINTFHLESASTILAEAVGQALAGVDRRLVFVALKLGDRQVRAGAVRDFSPEGLTLAIDQTLQVSGLEHVDLVILDDPAADEMPQASLTALKAQRASGRVRLLGIAGDGGVMDAYISTNAFDVLSTGYSVNSPWAVRNRVKAAAERDMAVLGYAYFPDELTARKPAPAPEGKRGLFGWGAKAPVPTPAAPGGPFAFLHRTPHWSAEEICLAAALTEPRLSSIIIGADTPERVVELAAVAERELPPGVPAQIEMARVSGAETALSA